MAESYSVEAILSVSDRGFSSGMNRAVGMLERLAGKSSQGSSSVGKMARAFGIANLASRAVSAGVRTFAGSLGEAVRRYDTLDNSGRVFKNMGFSIKETESAMGALNDSIKGLPTPMHEAVQGVQKIASSTRNLGKSQKIFSALNNGILGFGGSAADVRGAVLQLSQAFSAGRIDGTTFNSMLNNEMGPALEAMASKMGITMGELKQGLSDGSISVEEFQDALIDLNENGGGGLASLEQMARDATQGIGTSMANAHQAVVRGITGMIEAINENLKRVNLPEIGQIISKVGELAEQGLGKLTEAVGPAIDKLRDLVDWAKKVWEVFKETGAIDAMKGALESLKGAAANVLNAFQTDAESLGETLGEVVTVVSDLVAGIADFIAGLDPDAIKSFALGFMAVRIAARLALAGIKAYSFLKTFNPFGIFSRRGKQAMGELSGTSSKTAQVITSIFKGLGTIIGSVFSGLTQLVKGIGTAVSGVVKSLGSAISTAAKGIGQGLSTAFKGLAQAISMIPISKMFAFAASVAIVIAALALLATQGLSLIHI